MDKTCARCGVCKSADSFYALDRTCKACRCERVRKNRASKVDYYREYDRQRNATPKRIAHLLSNTRKFRMENPEKYAAHRAVSNALRDGQLKKQPCCICHSEDSHAHHEDYSKPLSVVWLCAEHHRHYHMVRQVIEKAA